MRRDPQSKTQTPKVINKNTQPSICNNLVVEVLVARVTDGVGQGVGREILCRGSHGAVRPISPRKVQTLETMHSSWLGRHAGEERDSNLRKES